MVIIPFEVIIKYNQDILRLEKELDVEIELLGYNYAIVSSKEKEPLDKLLLYKEVEFVEQPFVLTTQDNQSFSSTGIKRFKQSNNLNGKGVILGIIDSGIDYSLPIFKDEKNNSKILYYWDQSTPGNPPKGFKEGTLYNNEEINDAISNKNSIPISITSSHGTHVAGICCDIAQQSNLIVVRVGSRQTDVFSRSTEFMRAIKFILDKSLELNMPVAINISYGSNEGSHRGLSLFEKYIDDMSGYWKNNIVVASGNNADKGGHKNINIRNNKDTVVEFEVGENETILNINIWPDFTDEFEVYMISPSNVKSQRMSLISGEIKNLLGKTKIKGYFYPISPYSLSRRITIQMTSKSFINSGIWKLVFVPTNIITGNIDIYLPTSEGISKNTKFLEPTKELTLTVPASAQKVITVGSYNSRTDIASSFSGEGDIDLNIIKPDILAPGEDIISVLPGGTSGALTGTSMATPHVTGVCALFMEWGIVNKNDLFMYSQKLKSVLINSAKRKENETYPNNLKGYGLLDLSKLQIDMLESTNNDYAMIRKERDKDSKIRKTIKRTKLVNEKEKKTEFIEIANISYDLGFDEKFKALNTEYVFKKLSDDFGVIYGKKENIKKLQEILVLPNIRSAEPVAQLSLLGEISLDTSNGIVATEEIGANFFKNNDNIQITGKGVLIAIIDTGIDYLHKDFIYADNTSKIVSIWDQSKSGTPPKGHYTGVEYNREDINKAILENDSSLSIDKEGHGTMLSGICCGMGNINSEYQGIAPDAELIIVKMDKINGYYSSSMLHVGVNYAINKAIELDKPVVINIGMGNSLLAGVTRRNFKDDVLYTRGRAMIAAIGNDANKETHTSGKIDIDGEYEDIFIEVIEEKKDVEVQIWVDKPDKMSALLISPTGEESKLVNPTNYTNVVGTFDIENTNYSIIYVYPTTYYGQQEIIITFTNMKPGIWTIRLNGGYITKGIYNAYIQNRNLIGKGIKFRNATSSSTINYPANYDDVISVGGYNSLDFSTAPMSSRGPSLDKKQNPDILAPSINIISTYPQNKYATISGTSAAAAHMCGAAAMYFQYTLVDNKYEYNAFQQIMDTYFKIGAKRNDDTIYPNSSEGYGRLDLKGTFDQFK